MIKFPDINPTIFHIGPFEIRWYGLLYVISFIIGYLFLKKLLKYRKINLNKQEYENLLFNMMLGVIIGGRIGYVIFYHFVYYLNNPLHIFYVWQGGMSFHGGALGVIIAGLLFCKKHNYNFYRLADPVMPLVAIGLGLGRIGNFINAELYGRPTDLPWGVIFPDSDGAARHPSQLYEAFAEGFLLFIISYLVLKKTDKPGVVFWLWMLLYGVFRFLIEFVRQPDAHLGTIIGFFTMGQILSLMMIIISIIAFFFLTNHKKTNV